MSLTGITDAHTAIAPLEGELRTKPQLPVKLQVAKLECGGGRRLCRRYFPRDARNYEHQVQTGLSSAVFAPASSAEIPCKARGDRGAKGTPVAGPSRCACSYSCSDRRLRGIRFIDPEDQEFKVIIKNSSACHAL